MLYLFFYAIPDAKPLRTFAGIAFEHFRFSPNHGNALSLFYAIPDARSPAAHAFVIRLFAGRPPNVTSAHAGFFGVTAARCGIGAGPPALYAVTLSTISSATGADRINCEAIRQGYLKGVLLLHSTIH
jgi:hypothetical protein